MPKREGAGRASPTGGAVTKSKSHRRSLIHRVLHSSLLRSCWSSTAHTFEEHPPAIASSSLLQQDGEASKHDSSSNPATTTKPDSKISPNNRETLVRRKTLTMNDKQKSESQLERLVSPENIELARSALRNPSSPPPTQKSSTAVQAAPKDEVSEVLTFESGPTSSSESLFFEAGAQATTNSAGQKTATSEQSADLSQKSTGRSLADYLRVEDEDVELDDQLDGLINSTKVETPQVTEWERYTTALPGIPSPPRPSSEDPYDDLIARALEDFDDRREWEWEMEQIRQAKSAQNSEESLVEFGPATREQSIRLAFARVKRHNLRAQVEQNKQNDTPKSYYFTKQIGEGSFSTVYKARRVDGEEEYAIKVMNKRQIARERKVQYVNREKDIMATLTFGYGGHPFIASIFCTFQDPERLYYVMSLAENGELLMWLRRLGSFDPQVTQFYASEMVSALEYLHNCGIIHRDLKPENILIKHDWHIIISDFGSAKIIGYDGDNQSYLKTSPLKSIAQRSTFVGTANYISPEVAASRQCGPESDFWALGAIIFQMISGLAPFRGINEYQILRKINTLQYRFPEGFDETAKNLVEKLLVVDVDKRLGHHGIDEIKDHPFFRDVRWESILDQTPPQLKPYLPASTGEPEFYSNINVGSLEPGLNNSAIARLMGIAPQAAPPARPQNSRPAAPVKVSSRATLEEGTPAEREKMSEMMRKTRLEEQKRDHPYHNFVNDSLIVKSGMIDKKKGLFARRRVFLLTEDARLLYVDPVHRILRGEIPITIETKTEAKNFRTFFVHTPTRTYYLFDPERRAMDWCEKIDQIRDSYFSTATESDLAKRQQIRLNVKKLGKAVKASVSN